MNGERASQTVERPLIDHASQRDVVVEVLLAAIGDGRLAPGRKLVVAGLAKQLGVAAATVRDALDVLKSLHLVEDHMNRPSRIVTPTPKWYVAMTAECAGLSVAAADLGIANATAVQRTQFAHAATSAVNEWSAREPNQLTAAAAVWELLQLLADFSANHYLAHLHASKRHALAFGMRHLFTSRNATMVVAAVNALAVAVEAGDRDEGIDIVRDLYAFVSVPYLAPDAS